MVLEPANLLKALFCQDCLLCTAHAAVSATSLSLARGSALKGLLTTAVWWIAKLEPLLES